MIKNMPKMKKYQLSIRNWPEDNRPRENSLKYGEQILSNAELLATHF
jgi:DNA repair protein RadC